MNPTSIEWVLNPDGTQGSTSNPFTGCLGPKGDGINCPYCYAERLANGRLKPLYLSNFNIPEMWQGEGVYGHSDETMAKLQNPFYPRLWPYRLKDFDVKSPKGIFVCDMSDWAAPWLPMAWKEDLMAAIRKNPQHRIYLLTHQPQELLRWSPYPDNCRVGVTATNTVETMVAMKYLVAVKASVKFLSIEPLVEHIRPRFGGIDLYWDTLNWVIIGSMTARSNEALHLSNRYPDLTLMPYRKMWTLQPEKEWVKEIINAADKAGIPVFLKDNLKPLLTGHWQFFDEIPQGDHPNYESISILRQEMPK